MSSACDAGHGRGSTRSEFPHLRAAFCDDPYAPLDGLIPAAYYYPPVITAGVRTLIAGPSYGALCDGLVEAEATVIDLRLGVADQEIVDLIRTVDKVGIDTPLGWPITFAEAVAGHSNNGSWPSGYRHDNTTDFRLRRTDVWIWRDLGLRQPLSVSSGPDRTPGNPRSFCTVLID